MLATSEYYSRSILGATMMLMGIALVPAIATAPMPPQLVLAKLNGRSIDPRFGSDSQQRSSLSAMLSWAATECRCQG